MAEQTEKQTGTVTRIFFESANFSAGTLSTDSGTIRFAGECSVAVDDFVTLLGAWGKDPKYGRQFQVTGVSNDEPINADGLARFLQRDDRFAGIGRSRAAKIVNAYGDRFEQVLAENPEAIAEAAGVNLETAEAMRDAWFEKREENKAEADLAAFGCGKSAARKLIERFGTKVVETVRKNPYYLIGKVSGLGFKSIDGLAIAAGHPKRCTHRAGHGIAYALDQQAQHGGHTWSSHDQLLTDSLDLLELDELDARSFVADMIAAMVTDGRLVAYPVPDGTAYMTPAMFEAERLVLATVLEYGKQSGHDPDAAANDVFAEINGAKPNNDQIDAIKAAASSRICVITGGAGVGKTFTLDRICQGFEFAGFSIALCAPTGKAAKRMEQSTGRKASTIHRLLEPLPEKQGDGSTRFVFQRHEQNKLKEAVIAVDEVSMVDTKLMASLFRAIEFGRTTVILMGDHNQLPPVGAGNVLRDLLAGDYCPVVRLEKVMRQAGELKANTNAVLEGRVTTGHEGDGIPEDGQDIKPWYLIGSLHSDSQVASTVVRMFETTLSKYRLNGSSIDLMNDVQVLTPMHRGEIGTVEMNRRLQRVWHKLNGRNVDVGTKGKKLNLHTGDKVIQTKNDYELNVMNGTIGVIVHDVKPKGGERTLTIKFDGIDEPVEVSGRRIYNVKLAYALTIHKVQGSEFPISIVVCHRAHQFMHHRGLLYTGISRASQSAIVLGDANSIRRCARKVVSDDRRTLMALGPDVTAPMLEGKVV